MPTTHAQPPEARADGARPGPSPEDTRPRAVSGALLLVFGVALGIRALHLREVALHDPFYTIASVDGAIYDEWARRLLEGGGLGEGVLYLGPLYPLFMAAVYAIFGASLPALKMVQVVLGAVSCGLVHEITRTLFGRRAALLAGLAAAAYGQFVFYAGTVMIVNVQVPLVLGLALAALHGLRRPGVGIWLLCGALLGLSALARQTTLLVAPVLALWILFGLRGAHPFSRRLLWGTTFGLAVCALVLPFSVRNYVVGDDFVLLNSTGGYNFYMGNQRGADGTWQVPSIGWQSRVDNPRAMRDAFTAVAERELGHSLKPSEVSSYWRDRGWDEIAADPLRWLRLEARKASLFVNGAEIWNNRSRAVSERFSWVLRLPLVELGAIAPLGMLGLLRSRRRWREMLPLHALLGAYAVSALLFFVLSRYRMPATLLLLPFGGFAVLDLLRLVRERAWRPLAGATVVLALLIAWVQLPLVTGPRLHMAWYNLGNKYRTLERYDEAIAAYHEALAEQPDAISTHNNLAIAYELGGRTDEAIAAWRRVLALGRRIGSERHVERAQRHLRTLSGSSSASAP